LRPTNGRNVDDVNVLPKGDDMRAVRILVAWFLVIGLSTSALAGDLQSSIAKAAEQQAPARNTKIDHTFLVPGSALFVGGMALAVYGFLHTKGGEFVAGEVSKESNAKLGGAGLALAGLGGAVLYLGSQHAKSAPSITVGAGRVAVSKQVSW
jgi:hypothetical protein